MSEAKEKPAPTKPKDVKGRKRLLIIAAAIVALVVVAGVTTFFLLRPADSGGGGEAHEQKESSGKRPFFVEFEMFTVNLKDPEKFLQIRFTFQVKTAEAAETLKDLMPVVRSAVIPVLNGQDAAEISSPEGMDKMCAAVTAAARKSIGNKETAEAIETVLVSHMIIQ
jgi:flagellar FliL protein